MNVRELISALEDCDSPDAEVLFANQPSWPMEYTVVEVVIINKSDEDKRPADEFDCNGCCRECPSKDECIDTLASGAPDPNDEQIVYLVEGRQKGYLNSACRHALGW